MCRRRPPQNFFGQAWHQQEVVWPSRPADRFFWGRAGFGLRPGFCELSHSLTSTGKGQNDSGRGGGREGLAGGGVA